MKKIILTTALFFAFTASAQPPNPLQPLNPPPQPQGNLVTTAKVYLGKSLFWDEQMSSTRTVACGTCHMPNAGGSDLRLKLGAPNTTNPGLDDQFGTADDIIGSPGVPLNFSDGSYAWSMLFNILPQVTGRKTQPATDAAYSRRLFWDGRAEPVFEDPITGAVVLGNGAALESQVLGPPLSSAEMSHIDRDWNDVAARIATSKPLALAPQVPVALASWIDDRPYDELFEEAFGSSAVTPTRIAMAIASYERVLYSDQTPHDDALRGGAALTPQEEMGRGLFLNRDCARCHGGPTLSDDRFHYTGVRPVNEDLGRFEVTGNPGDMGAFKSPGLRNVALRPPYFHNGQFETLEEVVDFYNRGGDFNAPNKSPLIRPLNMNQQQRDALVAFMRRPLIDERVEQEVAPFDRPTLYTESNRVPVVEGSGRAGSGGFVPEVVALEPPMADNASFTVATWRGLGGAQAVLVIDDSDPGSGPSIPATASFARVETVLQASGAGAGYGSVSLSLAGNPGLVNREWFGRWYIEDAGASGGVAVSPMFRFTVFGSSEQNWCLGDLDGDGVAAVTDLVALMGEMGPCPVPCSGDLDGDGQVNQADLTRLAAGWGTCPD